MRDTGAKGNQVRWVGELSREVEWMLEELREGKEYDQNSLYKILRELIKYLKAGL